MSPNDRGGGRRRSSDEITAEIARSREKLARDLEVARVRLSRKGLQHEAMGAIRGAGSRGSGAIDGVSEAAERQASRIGGVLTNTLARNPVITLLTVGVALLALAGSRRPGHSRLDAAVHDMSRDESTPVRADLPPPATRRY